MCNFFVVIIRKHNSTISLGKRRLGLPIRSLVYEFILDILNARGLGGFNLKGGDS